MQQTQRDAPHGAVRPEREKRAAVGEDVGDRTSLMSRAHVPYDRRAERTFLSYLKNRTKMFRCPTRPSSEGARAQKTLSRHPNAVENEYQQLLRYTTPAAGLTPRRHLHNTLRRALSQSRPTGEKKKASAAAGFPDLTAEACHPSLPAAVWCIPCRL